MEVVTFEEDRKALQFGSKSSIFMRLEKNLNQKHLMPLRVQVTSA
jgi:hypothetical protein